MSLLFSLLYHVAPNRERTRWHWTSPGSFFGTAVWALISLGFSFYISSFGSYGDTYGAFAGVAILIFWLYLTGLSILVGGEINAAVERQHEESGQPDDYEPVDAIGRLCHNKRGRRDKVTRLADGYRLFGSAPLAESLNQVSVEFS